MESIDIVGSTEEVHTEIDEDIPTTPVNPPPTPAPNAPTKLRRISTRLLAGGDDVSTQPTRRRLFIDTEKTDPIDLTLPLKKRSQLNERIDDVNAAEQPTEEGEIIEDPPVSFYR